MRFWYPKLAGPVEAAQAAEQARRQDRPVVFTNGLFDALHLGHLHLLDYCDRLALTGRLIVAVNSDASARLLKGPGRPLQTAVTRASVLAGLSVVDHVTIFDGEAELAELLRVVRPTVLVKGVDWQGRSIAGAEHAGRVEFVTLLKGHSTTAIVEACTRR